MPPTPFGRLPAHVAVALLKPDANTQRETMRATWREGMGGVVEMTVEDSAPILELRLSRQHFTVEEVARFARMLERIAQRKGIRLRVI